MDPSNSDERQEPKIYRRDIVRYKELIKQFKNSNSHQLYDRKCQIMYQVLQNNHVDEASQVNTQAMVESTILKLVGMAPQEFSTESRLICQFSADCGLGCVAKDTNDRIVGICFAYPLDAINQAHKHMHSDKRSREINLLWDAVSDLLTATPWHQYGDPSRMLYVEDVGVLKSASGRGIGYLAVKFSMIIAERKGYTHMVTVTINDIATYDVSVTNGMKVIRTIDISQITDDGQKVFQGIIDHETYFRLYIIRLNPSQL